MTNANTLTFLPSTRIGECGAKGKGNRVIAFPLFLIGGCGEDRLVRTILPMHSPKRMDYQWFQSIALILKQNPTMDWDWYSFSKNILAPNKEHLKRVLNIDDEKVDVLLDDGHVFINNFDGSWEEEGEDPENARFYPNFKNFLEKPLDELEY